jgi:formylmethanofuran dehydrogenase subunit E
MAERSRPECDYCGRTIRDRKWYEINGDAICIRCMNENFLKGDSDDDGDDDE